MSTTQTAPRRYGVEIMDALQEGLDVGRLSVAIESVEAAAIVHEVRPAGSVTMRSGRVVPVLVLVVSGLRDTDAHACAAVRGWCVCVRELSDIAVEAVDNSP